MTHSSLLVTTKPELLEQVVQTNLIGTMWGCQIVSKVMMRQRREKSNTGCIINVASLLGMKGGRGSTAYAASKAGVLGRELPDVLQSRVEINDCRSYSVIGGRARAIEYSRQCHCSRLRRDADDGR